jgi:predicted nucleotidyltransferase
MNLIRGRLSFILYGSRAHGEHDANSDYDIFAICECGNFEKDCEIFEGTYLYAFIYSEGHITEPDSFLIRIKDGIVLLKKIASVMIYLNTLMKSSTKAQRKLPPGKNTKSLAGYQRC